jgi:hypothetical protein
MAGRRENALPAVPCSKIKVIKMSPSSASIFLSFLLLLLLLPAGYASATHCAPTFHLRLCAMPNLALATVRFLYPDSRPLSDTTSQPYDDPPAPDFDLSFGSPWNSVHSWCPFAHGKKKIKKTSVDDKVDIRNSSAVRQLSISIRSSHRSSTPPLRSSRN